MQSIIFDRVTAVWVVLVLATTVSFTLASEDGVGSHPLASSLIIVIAFFKVRLVGRYFMELRDAPARLVAPFEGYCVIACAVLLGLFLIH